MGNGFHSQETSEVSHVSLPGFLQSAIGGTGGLGAWPVLSYGIKAV